MKFCVKCINDFSENEINNFSSTIYKEKKRRIDSFIDEDAKKRSIIGEIILNELLKNENINYNECEFNVNENGKPYISNKNVFFNISHSDSFIAVAISNNEIGIDIEENKKFDQKILRTFANEDEIKYVLNSDNKDKTYLKLYTSKEAYIKCNGLRLLNIKDFSLIKNNKINVNKYDIKNFIYEKYIISTCEKKRDN